MDDMPRKRLPNVRRERNRHGTLVWYFRRGDGPRVRLPDVYGSPEFMAAYYEAATAKPAKRHSKAKQGTFGWLVQRYKESAEFVQLGPSTRRVRDNLLQTICKDNGDIEITEFDRAAIVAGRDRRAETPAAANIFVKTMRILFRFAVEAGYLDRNPVHEVKLLKESPDGFPVWTDDDVAAFEARHPLGTKARLAMDLLRYTGLRISDVVQVGRQHVKDGTITIRPYKTRQKADLFVHVTISPALQRSLDAMPATGMLQFIVSERGTPFTRESFGNWFRDRCREAGVMKSAHGLRKRGAVEAAEAGATTNELMAMFGWSTAKEPERYTRAAERKRLAASGFGKRNSAAPDPAGKDRAKNDDKSGS